MKVLEEGNWKNPWSLETTCNTEDCGTKLLVEESDVKPVEYSHNKDFCFHCPTCGKQNVLKCKLPVRLTEKLEPERKFASGNYYDR